jgi:hypothetical protein
VKVPAWLRREIDGQRRKITAGTTTRAEAVRDLRAQLRAKGDVVVEGILDGWLNKRLGESGRVAAVPPEQLDLFPGLDLPQQLEVSPGRFKPVAVMTRGDWAAARLQARTKANNAAGYADALDKAWQRIERLLVDDELTTAQVIGRAA